MNNILKIAHRGAAGYAPENTISAFDKAIELGADMLECDVRLCKSGELILMHDETIDRTTNGKGKLSWMALSELQKFRTKDGKQILTLEEFALHYKKRIKMMLDVKSINAASKIVKLIKKHEMHDQILVASTYHPLLFEIVARDSEIKTAVSFDIYSYLKYILVKKLFVLPAKLTGSEIVNIYHKFINKEMVLKAHGFHLKIFAFPLKQKGDIDRLVKSGVDGIITDYPDLINEI